jgi:hypothetical protein
MYAFTEIEIIARHTVRERTRPTPRIPRTTRVRRPRGDSPVG